MCISRITDRLFTLPLLLQFRVDGVLPGRHVPLDAQHIRFAAYLAIFYIALAHSCGRVDLSFIPLTTARTLVARGHCRLSRFGAAV